MSWIIRVVGGAFAATALALIPSGAAVAQAQCPTTTGGQYPPGSGSLSTSSSSTTPGGSVTVSGCGFQAASSVNVNLVGNGSSVRLATMTADATGAISGGVTIPASTAPGQYTLQASGVNATGGALVLSAALTVADTSGDLVRTGSSSTAPLTAAGVGLVVLGGAAVYGARRRRAARSAA